ncbi:hypothetical protein F6J84_04420 [Microbacterium caowuchunii]|uniref:hypothetical protein n=1 Tax=Microbacterium caowuchunii TaxID=2614638 RepID=UPI001246E02E|nr:hypothetical protein [Microbacterium caowuchunii]QEV99428.1 hypothetical protein F6J84_04420 [Microbacterium caowuchunii]
MLSALVSPGLFTLLAGPLFPRLLRRDSQRPVVMALVGGVILITALQIPRPDDHRTPANTSPVR